MTIRQVLQHPKTGKWAYVEYNTGSKIESILGDKEFDTKEEAEEYSKGYTSLFSHEWKDPATYHVEKLKEERNILIKRLAEIDTELKPLN